MVLQTGGENEFLYVIIVHIYYESKKMKTLNVALWPSQGHRMLEKKRI